MIEETPIFEKNPRQIEAVKLAAKNKYTMLYGGSRSGKTFIAVYMTIVRASKCKSRHIIFRKTFNSAKTSIWMDTIPKVMKICFPNLTYKENKTDFFITLPNGSEIWIGGLDDGKRVEKHLGREFSTIYFNETSEIPYSAVTLILTRLAEKNILKKRAFFDSNPPKKSHWQYWLFEKKQDPMDEVPLENADEYASIIMNPGDNLDNLDEDYIKMLERLPEAEKRRFLLGEYADESDGEAYYAFDRERHVKEIPQDIIDAGGTLFVGMDFNVHPMTAVIGRYINDTFYVFDEVFLEHSDTFKMTDALVKQGHAGAQVIPDSTGKARKTSGKSDHQILKDAGFTLPYVKNPFVTDRVNTMNNLFTHDRIVISPKCKKLIGDLEKVVWKNNKLDQKTNPMLTHISDAFGYWVWHLAGIKPKKKENKTINF